MQHPDHTDSTAAKIKFLKRLLGVNPRANFPDFSHFLGYLGNLWDTDRATEKQIAFFQLISDSCYYMTEENIEPLINFYLRMLDIQD